MKSHYFLPFLIFILFCMFRSHNSSCDELHNHIDLAHFHGGVPLPETPNGVAAANAAAKAVANASGSDDKPLSF